MKTQSIILRGERASGKSFLSNIMISLLKPENVLSIDADGVSVVYLAREINAKDFDLIVLEDCQTIEAIVFYDKWLKTHFDHYSFNVKNILYLTSDVSSINPEGFKIIECKFSK